MDKLPLVWNSINSLLLLGMVFYLFFGVTTHETQSSERYSSFENLGDEEFSEESFQEALLTYDRSYCLTLESLESQEFCVDRINLNLQNYLSVREENVSLCNNLVKEELISSCIENYDNYLMSVGDKNE